MKITHDTLVEAARRWLSRKCRFVVCEKKTMILCEEPDALGFTGGGLSLLIECKTSLSDFHADKHKPSRRIPWEAMGMKRWFMTPPGLLSTSQLPEGWGLLEYRPSKHPAGHYIKQLAEPGKHQHSELNERLFLISVAANALDALERRDQYQERRQERARTVPDPLQTSLQFRLQSPRG